MKRIIMLLALAAPSPAYGYEAPPVPPTAVFDALLGRRPSYVDDFDLGFVDDPVASRAPVSTYACGRFTPGSEGAPTEAEAKALCERSGRCACDEDDRVKVAFHRVDGRVWGWRLAKGRRIEPLEGAAEHVVAIDPPRKISGMSHTDVLAARETLRLAMAVDLDLPLLADRSRIEGTDVRVSRVELEVIDGPKLRIRAPSANVVEVIPLGDRREMLGAVHRIGLSIGRKLGGGEGDLIDDDGATEVSPWTAGGLNAVVQRLDSTSTERVSPGGLLDLARARAWLALIDSRAAPLRAIPNAAKAIALAARAERYGPVSSTAKEIEAMATAGATADEGALALLTSPELPELKAFVEGMRRTTARRPEGVERATIAEVMVALYVMYVIRDKHDQELDWYRVLDPDQAGDVADLMLYHLSFGAKLAVRAFTSGKALAAVSASIRRTCQLDPVACVNTNRFRPLGLADAVEDRRALYARHLLTTGRRQVLAGSWREWLTEQCDRALQVMRHRIHNRKILGHHSNVRQQEREVLGWVLRRESEPRSAMMGWLALAEVTPEGDPRLAAWRDNAKRHVWREAGLHPSLYLNTDLWQVEKLKNHQRLSVMWAAQRIDSPRIAMMIAKTGPAPAAALAALQKKAFFQHLQSYLPLFAPYFVARDDRWKEASLAEGPFDGVLSVMRTKAEEALKEAETREEGIQGLLEAHRSHPASFDLSSRLSKILVKEGRLDDAEAVWRRTVDAKPGGFLEIYIAKQALADVLLRKGGDEDEVLELSRAATKSGAAHRYHAHALICLWLGRVEEAREHLDKWKHHYGASGSIARLTMIATLIESNGERGWDAFYADDPLEWKDNFNREVFEVLEHRGLLERAFREDEKKGRAVRLEAIAVLPDRDWKPSTPKEETAVLLARLSHRPHTQDSAEAMNALISADPASRFTNREWRRKWKERVDDAANAHFGRAMIRWARARDEASIERALEWLRGSSFAKERAVSGLSWFALAEAREHGAQGPELGALAAILGRSDPLLSEVSAAIPDLTTLRLDGWHPIGDAIQRLWFEGKSDRAYAILERAVRIVDCAALSDGLHTLAGNADRAEAWARRFAPDDWCLDDLIAARLEHFFDGLSGLRPLKPSSKLVKALNDVPRLGR